MVWLDMVWLDMVWVMYVGVESSSLPFLFILDC